MRPKDDADSRNRLAPKRQVLYTVDLDFRRDRVVHARLDSLHLLFQTCQHTSESDILTLCAGCDQAKLHTAFGDKINTRNMFNFVRQEFIKN